MKRSIAVLLILAAVALLCSETISITQFERRVFDATNAQRHKLGLPALKPESGLDELAKLMSRFMGVHDFFDHTDQEGNDISGRQLKYYPELLQVALGENLAFYQRSDRKFNPEQVVVDWMNSPGHRENIVNPTFTHLGVGAVIVGYKLYVTQNFATPLGKIVSPLPKKIRKNSKLNLEIEYLGSEPASKLKLALDLPDPKQMIRVSDSVYYQGSIPLKVEWKDKDTFLTSLPFVGGKGVYRLNMGFGVYYYSDLIDFRVK
jgi:uncharacterized protein YkwD